MAELVSDPYPGNWTIDPSKPPRDEFRRIDKLLNALDYRSDRLRKSEFVGTVVRIPCYDSHAIYVVTSVEPLRLQWVPGYDKHNAYFYEIEDLTLDKIAKMRAQARRLQTKITHLERVLSQP